MLRYGDDVDCCALGDCVLRVRSRCISVYSDAVVHVLDGANHAIPVGRKVSVGATASVWPRSVLAGDRRIPAHAKKNTRSVSLNNDILESR